MKKLTHTINRGYKFRFYPTHRQKELLKSYFGANRWVWNKALDYCSTYYSRYEESVLPFTHSKVGADLGLEHALILSNGKKFENPRILAKKKAQLKTLQQRLARQVKGSNRWRETKRRIAKLHWTIGNQRRDYLHKLTTELIRNNQVIAVEDLNVKGLSSSAKGTIEQPGRMVKQKSGLNKSILDVSFGSIVAMLEYKAEFYGREVIKINRFFPSSKLCSCCGEKMEAMPLKTREWTCRLVESITIEM